MKQFEFDGWECHDLHELGTRLVGVTIMNLYSIYRFEPNPEKEKQDINKVLGNYHTYVSELEKKVRISIDTKQKKEKTIANSLYDYVGYLSQAKVEDGDYLKQRDEITEEIVKRVSGITKGLVEYEQRLSGMYETFKKTYATRKKQDPKLDEEIFRGVK